MNSSKDICLYNKGAYTFFPAVWGGKPLDVKEVCCYFEGAPYCEYHLKFPVRNRWHEIISRFFTSRSVLEETIEEMETDKRVIDEKYEEVNRLNEKLYKKYNEVNYLNDELKQKVNQLQAIHNTGKAILSVLDLDQLLAIIMNTLSNICKVDRSIIMLIDKQEEYLVYLYGIGISEDTRENIKDYKIPLDRVNNILVRVINKGHSEYIPDVGNSNLKKENELLKKADFSAVYVVPLTTGSRVIGVIAADAVKGNEISRETRETLEVFAPQIAIAIANAALYQELQEQMEELKQSQALLSRADKLSYL
ncbi:MAG: GAF domain-containing protein, partial [Deltaproteobacteria bacterium]|nr:GAF domain-containing protein [Deltaproteobacteria bacterium]